MKKILMMVCLSAAFLGFGISADAKKKEACFQMYSVRELIGNPEKFAQNHKEVLAKLAKMGYTSTEAANYDNGKLYGLSPEEYKAAIEASGLKVLSSHVGHNLSNQELASGDFSEALKWWDQCIDCHKRAGMKYIVNPGVNYPKTLKEADIICKYMDAVGEKVNAAGMKFGYHNHSHEFGKVEGKVWYDYMVEHTDADKVFFEMDVYWAVRGQVSPVEYFNRYPGRFLLLHIKDHRELGQSGMVGFDAIFNNAEKAGMKTLVVELEGSNKPNILDGMKESIDYIKASKFVKASYDK
ncbi:MAG: sugar phosphate isomerase/epimerase [Bacteroidaceae bacterium]|jgi:sugar phosphate isomerase/epimerase|nr:sugar phosphate isomerase/epimerase [Bacteroidaceae bacterium]